MRYLGGKSRIAKHIAPIINQAIHWQFERGRPYYEPFCGMLSVTIQIDPKVPRHCSDANPYVIDFWRAVQSGWDPPQTITEEQYNHIRSHQTEYPPELVAFVGFGCSFGAKWFAGFERDFARVSAARVRRSVQRKAVSIGGVTFRVADYQAIDYPDGCVIYCDIPYQGTTGYSTGEFDHGVFWGWARDRAQRGCAVFVSEYRTDPPVSVAEVWSATYRQGMKARNKTDRLFLILGT